jgi:1,4-alpha-glucan branching enzyme
LDNCFEFDLASAMLNVMKTNNTQALRTEMNYAYNNLEYNKFSTFLTNHDQNRVFDELGGSMSKLKTAASIYLTLPGTPYLYYGEEVGMKGSKPDELIRTPMQWTSSANAGFTSATPWISINSNYSSYNVQLMQADMNSLLNYYKKLIQTRNKYQALSIGTYQNIICSDTAVFSFLRVYNNQTFLVMINTSGRNASNLYMSLNALNWNNGTFTANNVLNNGADYLTITDNVGTGVNLLPYETKVIQLDKNTSLSEVIAKTNFTIFPNPSNENITISMEGMRLKPSYEVQIFNAIGELVLTENIQSNQNNSINIEKFSKGIHFVKLDNGTVKKLIKE